MNLLLDLDNTKILKFNPVIFFSAGEALGYKDRDNNIDAKMIQAFFEPIDKLFGDYEIMKKFGIHDKLYQNKIFNEDRNFIKNIDDVENIKFFSEDNKEFIEDTEYKLDVLKSEIIKQRDAVLIIFLTFNTTTMAFKVGSFVINKHDIFLSEKAKYFEKIQTAIGNNNKIIQAFAIDPEKLIQIGDLDEAFQGHNIKVISRDTGIAESIIKAFVDLVNNKKTALAEVGKLKEFNINKHDSIEEFLSFLGVQKDKYINYKEFKELALKFRDRTYKLKLFEPHVYFKIRLGYENDHFVLFLHPYESESNNPVRFPPGGQ